MHEHFMFYVMLILLILTASVWWQFCIVYTLRGKWWKNPYGRNVFSVGAANASLYTMLVIYAVTGSWTLVLTVVASILLLWSLIAATRRIVLMDRIQAHL